jgi:hypothetical protein
MFRTTTLPTKLVVYENTTILFYMKCVILFDTERIHLLCQIFVGDLKSFDYMYMDLQAA